MKSLDYYISREGDHYVAYVNGLHIASVDTIQEAAEEIQEHLDSIRDGNNAYYGIEYN